MIWGEVRVPSIDSAVAVAKVSLLGDEAEVVAVEHGEQHRRPRGITARSRVRRVAELPLVLDNDVKLIVVPNEVVTNPALTEGRW